MRPSIFTLLLLLLCGSLAAQTFTPLTGLFDEGSGGSACAVDMDGDMLDDLVRFSNGNVVVYHQKEDGSFERISYPAGMTQYPSWSVCAGDLNRDNMTDIMVGDGDRVSFLISNPDGLSFTERYEDNYIFTQRTNLMDVDNDGDLDAFACHDVDQNHPFRNDGLGNMVEDQSVIETVPLAGNYASLWTDFDNDGDLDMYLAKCRSGAAPGAATRDNAVYVNDGNGNFTEEASQRGLFDNEQSWVTIFEDFDNDGDFDTYTVNHTGTNFLRENDGTGHFTDISEGSGLDLNDLGSWALIGADFDNDGLVDILTESSFGKTFYHNDGNFQFTAVSLPFDDGALCDVNNDGFIDVYNFNTVYINDGNDNNWLKVGLKGIISNTHGTGARVTLYGDFGLKLREARIGQGYAPMSTHNLHFGLGTHETIDSMVINWPSGIKSVIENPGVNEFHIITEGDCFFTAPDIVASGDVVLCPGETVSLSAADGFEYYWSNGANTRTIEVNGAGTYQVNLVDGDGCVATSNSIVVELLNPTAPTVVVDGNLEFCQGGSVTLTASDEAGYMWSNDENTQSIEVSETGTYAVSSPNACGELTSEEIEVKVLDAPTPDVMDIEVFEPGTVEVTADGEALEWFADIDGTESLGTGETINVDITEPLTTVYVQNSTTYSGVQATGGKPDDTGSGGIPGSANGYTRFDVYETLTIQQVTVYVLEGMPGERTVNLHDETGAILMTTTADLVEGPNQIVLGWEVQPGIDYSLRCPEANLFRNSGGVNYPYPLGDLGAVTGSFYGPSYYYFFYNWKVQGEDRTCTSDLVAVSVTLTGVEDIVGITDFKAFPNPTNDLHQVQFNNKYIDQLEISVITALGQQVQQWSYNDLAKGPFTQTIDLKDLPSGIYMIQLKADEQTASYRLVKE